MDSIIFLILLIFAICFFIATVSGIIRFLADVKKFSSYKAELDDLIDKYRKLCPDFDNVGGDEDV